MRILNLTQHPCSSEQADLGVIEPRGEGQKALVQNLLTFETPPSGEELTRRARALRHVALGNKISRVMIGGAPFFMAPLEEALLQEGFIVLYAFSKREVIEQELEDGQVKKTAIFKQVGWVEAQDRYKS